MEQQTKGYFLVFGSVLFGAFVSLLMEKMIRPQSAGLRRSWASYLSHVGCFFILSGFLILILGKPIFGAFLVLAWQFSLIMVNNAKFRALREPFLFSDFGIIGLPHV